MPYWGRAASILLIITATGRLPTASSDRSATPVSRFTFSGSGEGVGVGVGLGVAAGSAGLGVTTGRGALVSSSW